MEIAFCYESVLPARGGCEHYIADITRRLAADGHRVALYACRWDAAALPAATRFRRLPAPGGPRALRPWRFAEACLRALAEDGPQVSVGFDKTWGQDILYPQGGLHLASAEHNLRKHRSPWRRGLARLAKGLDPASWSFALLARRQYLGPHRPLIVANSEMVRGHFRHYYGIPAEAVRVLPSAVNPDRFAAHDRPRLRAEWRDRWELGASEAVGLFLGVNYRLKGLAPLLEALPWVPADRPFRLLVAGHPHVRPYERLARHLGVADRVRFIGRSPESRFAYFAADFLVHPTFYDPCSLVVLEALGCGLPVITTRYNGAAELLRPAAAGAVLDDPHDSSALARAITRLLDPGTRADAARAARQAAAAWTFDDHYRGLLCLLAEAAERKRAA
jgi:UDP-glucose:(heptosyl)LPS alpha-1,3-glucosyltransferase